jgi:hypothetical protein
MDIIKLTEVETTTCSRCCGSGRFSHCVGYGDRCFKCRGSGKTKTKRGEITNAYIRSLRVAKKPMKELTVGSLIYGMAGLGGSNFQRKWVKVVAIEVHADNRVSIKCESEQYSIGASGEYLVECRIAEANDATTFDDGMAFQATLTKAGKPTKATSAAHRAWLDGYIASQPA